MLTIRSVELRQVWTLIVVSTKDWFHCGRDRSPTLWWSFPALRGLWRPFINMLCQNHAQSATSQNSWWSHSLLVILVSGGEWWNKVMLACNFKRKYFQSKGCREFADLVFVFFLLFFLLFYTPNKSSINYYAFP